jgi:hypothetical protein
VNYVLLIGCSVSYLSLHDIYYYVHQSILEIYNNITGALANDCLPIFSSSIPTAHVHVILVNQPLRIAVLNIIPTQCHNSQCTWFQVSYMFILF